MNNNGCTTNTGDKSHPNNKWDQVIIVKIMSIVGNRNM